jgi:hypothetical protein
MFPSVPAVSGSGWDFLATLLIDSSGMDGGTEISTGGRLSTPAPGTSRSHLDRVRSLTLPSASAHPP